MNRKDALIKAQESIIEVLKLTPYKYSVERAHLMKMQSELNAMELKP